MINLKDSPYWEIYSQCWQLFKEALPVRSDQSYWDQTLARCEAIAQKYAATPQAEFAKDQVFSVINELDRIKRAGSFDSLRPGTEKN